MKVIRWQILNWCLVVACLILIAITLRAIAHYHNWIAFIWGCVTGAAFPTAYLVSSYFEPIVKGEEDEAISSNRSRVE
jgi:hypothetical protein